MTRHTASIAATFAAALVVSVSAAPAKTSAEKQITFNAQPQSILSAQIHTMVDSSFHAMHIGF